MLRRIGDLGGGEGGFFDFFIGWGEEGLLDASRFWSVEM